MVKTRTRVYLRVDAGILLAHAVLPASAAILLLKETAGPFSSSWDNASMTSSINSLFPLQTFPNLKRVFNSPHLLEE